MKKIIIFFAAIAAFLGLGMVIAANAQPAPTPLGWVYLPYTQCMDPPVCTTGIVAVPADGLNVRQTPNGYPTLSLVNGVTFIPLQREGDWLLIAPACDLTPTWVYSWTAPTQLYRCWVY